MCVSVRVAWVACVCARVSRGVLRVSVSARVSSAPRPPAASPPAGAAPRRGGTGEAGARGVAGRRAQRQRGGGPGEAASPASSGERQTREGGGSPSLPGRTSAPLRCVDAHHLLRVALSPFRRIADPRKGTRKRRLRSSLHAKGRSRLRQCKSGNDSPGILGQGRGQLRGI